MNAGDVTDVIRTLQCPYCPARVPLRLRQASTGLLVIEVADLHRCPPVDTQPEQVAA